MTTRMLAGTLAVLGIGAPAAAQEIALPPTDVFTFEQAAPAGATAGVFFRGAVDVLDVEPLDVAEPVVDAPYSADATTEVIQPLADGNRIERRSTSTIARDGRGRGRREQQLAAVGPFVPAGDAQFVTITDPVASVHYTLDRERKVAIRMPLPVIKRIEGRAGVAMPGVRVTRVEGARAAAPRTESLGTRDVEGVRADGTRTTTTIEAGAIGNVAPIEIVSERWFSPELKTVVLSRRSDPRFGDTTYRLENIVRGEPSPELFRVPTDYTVDTRPVGGGVRMFEAPVRQR